MSWFRISIFLVIVALLPMRAIGQKQPPAKPQSPIDKLVDRITAREHQEVQIIRKYQPIIETYIQDVRPDKELGIVPVKDHYFIGVADLAKGVVLHNMADKDESPPHKLPNPLRVISLAPSYVPEGFLEMIYVDPRGFDRRHYIFEYIHKEFLGNVRCLVFDVTPAPDSGNGRFRGRIWVEDRNYTIVRFSGVFEPVVRQFGFYLHFDSWRENAGPGLWLPTCIYNGETEMTELTMGHLSERSQTRLWGYSPIKSKFQEEFSQLNVESANVNDATDTGHDSAPLQQEREYESQGAERVLEKLERAHMVAPPGEVDQMLNKVVNNLEVTNNLTIQPELKCRVLLVTTFEISLLGDTILISRGLLDVLPDEATLAAILAHEVAHRILAAPMVPTWAFADQSIFPDDRSLQVFSFYAAEDDEEEADHKALELMQNSPYKDHLANAGLFFRQLEADSKQLTALISPHLRGNAFLNGELIKLAPLLEPARLDQIAALPLGSRIKLDPWSSGIELSKSKPVELNSLQEKLPLELTPFYPYLTRESKLEPNGTVAK